METGTLMVGAALAGVVAVAKRRTLADWLARLKYSATAAAHGVSNEPDNAAEAANLAWLADVVDDFLRLASECDPECWVSSGYRSDAVNAAVGGSNTSEHRTGLAFDLATSRPFELAKYLKTNAARFVATPHQVIAETTPYHVHIGFYGPDRTGPTQWLGEYSTDQFTTLR